MKPAGVHSPRSDHVNDILGLGVFFWDCLIDNDIWIYWL